MKIIVIIVTYNGIYWLDKCLGSLRTSSLPLHTIVIDNLSTDSTVSYIQTNFTEVQLIQNTHNAGFGQANNVGIRLALEQGADYIFLLNQDAWIEPSTCEKLIKAHQLNDGFGIISPLHLTSKANVLDKNFASYMPYNTLGKLQQMTNPFIVPFVNAAAWMMTREVIEKVGGFDPLFNHYGEDRDYCQRIKYHDFQIAVLPTATICHDRKYNPHNSYRKQSNMLFAIGLAHLKNITIPFSKAIAGYIIKRSKKSVKAFLTGNFTSAWNEWIVMFKILKMKASIAESRNICKNNIKAFL